MVYRGNFLAAMQQGGQFCDIFVFLPLQLPLNLGWYMGVSCFGLKLGWYIGGLFSRLCAGADNFVKVLVSTPYNHPKIDMVYGGIISSRRALDERPRIGGARSFSVA